MPLRALINHVYNNYAPGTRKSGVRTHLSQLTELSVGVGPPVKVFHQNELTTEQIANLKSAIEEARNDAINGFHGLHSKEDEKVGPLRDEFQNSFRFDRKFNPVLLKKVVGTAELIKNGVMSSNLSIKFYEKNSPKPKTAVGTAELGLSRKKNSQITISLSERAFRPDYRQLASITINHEVAHNAADLTDFSPMGYANPDFTEVSSEMVPTQAFSDSLKAHQAVRNADSYAVYMNNRATILKALDRTQRLPSIKSMISSNGSSQSLDERSRGRAVSR